MNSQLHALLWSEWRQRRTQFVFCLLWMLGAVAYVIASELRFGYRLSAGEFSQQLTLYGLFFSIFIAMRTSLGEVTNRTRSFSEALPVSRRRQAWIRLGGGSFVLITPILIAAVLLSCCLVLGWIQQVTPNLFSNTDWESRRWLPSWKAGQAVGLMLSVGLIGAMSINMLYLVLSLVGTKLRVESHVGFAGVIVLLIWLLFNVFKRMLNREEYSELALWMDAIMPPAGQFGTHVRFQPESIVPLIGPMLLNVVFQFALAVLFVRHFCRAITLSARSLPTIWSRLPWPRWSIQIPTRTSALAWLTLRQTVPICIAGLAIICLMVLFDVSIHSRSIERFAHELSEGIWQLGFLWCVVVGAGIFAMDIDWRVGEFWRALPISVGRLFTIKFLVGLLAVILVLDGSAVAAGWNSSRWGTVPRFGMNWASIAWYLPLHALVFAIAVAWTCVLRRPVLGGMAAILTMVFLQFVAHNWGPIDPRVVYLKLIETRTINLMDHGYPMMVTIVALLFSASALIAWRALRRYDPRRQMD